MNKGGWIFDEDGDVNVAGVVGLLIGFFVIVTVVIFMSPFVVVGAGERAVVTSFGAVKGELGPGIHFLAPISQSATILNVQTQKEQTDAGAASKDLQNVNATVAVNYNVDPNKVTELYTTVGVNFKGTIIDPAIQEVVKSVTANYTAEELITKRPQVTDEIQTALAAKLIQNDIIVTSISITEFKFSDTFTAAIEAKVTAQQNALAAQNKLQQVQFEAQQTIATAQATAEAQRISSAALAAQGGADYVQLKAIEKWNGVLPAQMIPGSSVPFLNLTK